MQTPERITVGTARKIAHKPDREALSLRSEPAKKNYSAQRCCNSFLKTTFQSTVPSFIIKDYGDGTFNIITQENYDFLRDSYFRYAELLNVKADHTPGRTLNDSINQLFYDLETILSDKIGLNIEMYDGRLHFTLWKYHRWGTCELYYFPIKFLTQVNAELRRIAISFLNRFMRANGIGSILDCDEHECIMESILWEHDTNETDKEIIKDRKRIESYQTGAINKLLKRVETKSYHDDIHTALHDYKPVSAWESKLIDAMLDGMEFLDPKKPIMDYDYDPYFEEEPDIYPVRLHRQICIVYEDDDIVTRTLIDFINSDYRESYEIIPVTTMKLTPDTKSLFKISDEYPERFFQWSDKFINIIRNFES